MSVAGCAGGDGPADPSATGANPGSGASATQLQAPAPLRVGDWWNYTVGVGGSWSYIVTAAGSSDYTMETDTPSLAFFNARSDVSTLGAIRVSDLAGSQGETRVEFLRWPLTEGKNWTTTWDGETITVRVHLASPTVAQLTGYTANGTKYVTYTYDRAVKWFTEIDFKDDDGESAFGIQLARHGGNFTGSVARWTLDHVVTMSGDLAQPEQPGQFEVPLTATDVWVRYAISCTAGQATLGVAPMPLVPSIAGADERGAGEVAQQCPFEAGFSGPAGAPKVPAQGGTSEAWGFSVISNAPSAGTYEMEILVRTLAWAPVA